ncbi:MULTISPECIES: hypothetical protein [Streptomyces]|uniref:hypothetical protein n=1 Tax=Streptomyces TaxID=1883 RepID=UPI0027D88699|nr:MULTISPECIES: hypothetical protein [unclassified Streptomyces]MDX3487395.1 hypothetical protein [Streptomyces sp. ID05-18]
MQPVLETYVPDDFSLWPVAEGTSSRFTALSGNLTSAEVGTALMLIARCNDIDPDPGAGDDRPPRPADPLASFLHGLLTFDDLFASGGLRVVDGSTGVTLLPGCCSGLEDWRGMYGVLDGTGSPFLGHDPDPVVDRSGASVRLVVDFEQSDSPVIELSAVELRRLLDGVGRDLADFLALASDWVRRHLPDHAEPVIEALVRVLAVPASGSTRQAS